VSIAPPAIGSQPLDEPRFSIQRHLESFLTVVFWSGVPVSKRQLLNLNSSRSIRVSLELVFFSRWASSTQSSCQATANNTAQSAGEPRPTTSLPAAPTSQSKPASSLRSLPMHLCPAAHCQWRQRLNQPLRPCGTHISGVVMMTWNLVCPARLDRLLLRPSSSS
jgi:hypothetical protein